MNYKQMLLAVCMIGLPSVASVAATEDNEQATKKSERSTEVKRVERTEESGARRDADNTKTNQRDRRSSEPTADQQKNGKSDVNLTAEIRRSIMKEKSFSTNAHNIKIIAQNGIVTLKGPVKNETEKTGIEKIASDVAGQSNVKSEIEIAR